MTGASLARSMLFLATFVPPATAAAQSAMFRGGPEHLGVYASAAPTLSALAWKFKTGDRVLSSPLVVADAVYVGSTDGSLYAIDRAGHLYAVR